MFNIGPGSDRVRKQYWAKFGATRGGVGKRKESVFKKPTRKYNQVGNLRKGKDRERELAMVLDCTLDPLWLALHFPALLY